MPTKEELHQELQGHAEEVTRLEEEHKAAVAEMQTKQAITAAHLLEVAEEEALSVHLQQLQEEEYPDDAEALDADPRPARWKRLLEEKRKILTAYREAVEGGEARIDAARKAVQASPGLGVEFHARLMHLATLPHGVSIEMSVPHKRAMPPKAVGSLTQLKHKEPAPHKEPAHKPAAHKEPAHKATPKKHKK